MQSKFALQIECFLFVLCGKSKNIPGRNKKIPEDFVGKKVFGEGDYGIRKGYAAGVGVTGVSGVTSLPASSVFQLLTSVSRSIASPPTGKVNL